MGDGRDSPGLDPSSAGRLLRAVSIEPTGAPGPAPSVSSPLSGSSKPVGGEAALHSPIPGYSIDRLLGEGGGGTVYRAFREGSDRPLALKVLKARAGDKAAKRAWRELEILENLRLPCLPRLIDYGEHAGHLYFATEFIEGEHLDHCCTSRSLPLRRRVEILAAVADAAQSLHEHGVIHRDLKPSNIIVADDGQPMLVDLGLAALAETDQTQWTMTEDGAPIGTPAFMAPEQARGERSRISTRTDVYGLGATAYLVLTGSTPHDTNTSIHEAVRRVAQEESRDPRSLSPGLARPLAAVLRKACEREPQGRYAAAAELSADLRRWLSGERVEASEFTTWTSFTHWLTRHPVLATALLCILIFLVTVAASYGTIVRLNTRPSRFAPNIDSREITTSADLLSGSGRVLARVGGGAGSQVAIAELVDWPREFRCRVWSGSQVAVVAVSSTDGRDDTRGCLWVCDPADLTKPLFSSPADNLAPTPPSPYNNVEELRGPLPTMVKSAILAEVFEQNPGPEIVTLEVMPPTSASVTRVYSLRCERLFETWHCGSLYQAFWWPEQGLIICAGDRHGKQTHTWEKLGYPGVESMFPKVIFALRPRFKQDNGWLDDSSLAGPDQPLAWYKALWPPQASDVFALSSRRPVSTGDWRNRLQVNLQVLEKGAALPALAGVLSFPRKAGINLELDERGEIVPGRTRFNDGWESAFADKAAAEKAAKGYVLLDFPTGVPRPSAPSK